MFRAGTYKAGWHRIPTRRNRLHAPHRVADRGFLSLFGQFQVVLRFGARSLRRNSQRLVCFVDGVIPTKYKRVACPVVGNLYIWLRQGGEYYFQLSVVNASGLGSITKVEAQLKSGAWSTLIRDANYTSSRPQERFGAWVVKQGEGPFALPMSLRITDPSGRTLLANGVVKAWPDASQQDGYYIDTGVQF